MKLRLKGQPILKFPIIVSFHDEDTNTFQFGYTPATRVFRFS